MGLTRTIERRLIDAFHFLTHSEKPPTSHGGGMLGDRISRRDALFGGALASALLAASGCPTAPDLGQGDDELDPDDPAKGMGSALRKLVDRCTFGANKDELKLAKELGYEGYLEYHLDYLNIDDSELEQDLSRFATLDLSARQIANEAEMGNWEAEHELVSATILRSAYSKRQLYQKLVEFWTDHFNIYIEKDWQYYLKPVDDREVVRKYALGTFPQLLSASAHSPAMLAYLDNDPSSSEAPNQNYARELMELHTIGIGNFTQKDVIEVSRCFTGWSIVYDYQDPKWGTFRFYRWAHDKKRKNVLGHDIPRGGGIEDGETVLRILSEDPAISQFTARFLGKKLANYFWGYGPPGELVDSIAAAYTSTRGDIKAMVRAALEPTWMESAPPKLKRPYHYVVSALRSVPSSINNFWTARYVLRLMGHEPFHWAAPNGYPDALNFWSGLLLPRWRFGALIFLQQNEISMDLSQFEGAMPIDQFMKKVNKVFFNGKMPASDKNAIRTYIEGNPNSAFRRLEALGLAISCSGYQWY